MALSFPSDPINGAVSGEYTYDATKGAWRKNAAYPVSVTHSDVAPSNPRVGDQWWKSNEGTLFTYYNDGTSSQWVESTNVVANVEPNPIPAGAMMAWGSDIIPANWLLCDGSAVSRSTYASLFAIIGTQYGSGDGTTTFNLPNIKGRTIVGRDASQTEFDTLGETGGAKTHTLTTAEMPSHTHTGTTSSAGSHIHRILSFGGGSIASGGDAIIGNYAGYGNLNWTRVSDNGWIESAGAHTHTFTSDSTGSGGAHNNLQPYIVLNYIIKYSSGETPGDSQLATRVGTLETQNNATPLSPNYVINGGFDIWQRGTNFTATGVYGPDRWKVTRNNAGTGWSGSRISAPGAGFQYGLRMQRTANNTSADPMFVGYAWESSDVIKMQSKVLTLSYYLRGGANLSNSIGVYLAWGTGTDEQSFAALTNESALVVVNNTLSTTLTRYSVTFSVPATATSMRMNFSYTPSGTAGASDYFDVTGVQLEDGAYATPFRRNAPSIQAELAACQRYYIRFTGGTPYGNIGTGFTFGGSYTLIMTPLPVEMRVPPTSVEFSTLRVYDSSVAVAVTNVTLNSNFNTNKQAAYTVDGGTVTVNRPALLQGNNNINYYLGLSAEL